MIPVGFSAWLYQKMNFAGRLFIHFALKKLGVKMFSIDAKGEVVEYQY